MALITLEEALDFLGIDTECFTITAANDVLKMKYQEGTLTDVDVADGTYSGDEVAAALETAIDAAFTITSTVAYDSSTKKFTITAPVGTTLSYTHTGSDAGWTFGFSQDHSAASSITSDNAASDPTAMVDLIRQAAEAYIQNMYCKQTFESTNHKDLIDGDGTQEILLDHYPIISLSRLSIGTQDAISVTNSTAAHASVSVSSAAVTLYADGVTTTLSLTTYSTMTTLAAAISAVSGWSGALMSTSYGTYPSTLLVEKFGLQCADSSYAYLQMPDDGEADFEVYSDEGKVYLYAGFPEGHRNIFVDYTAGYATIPEDLKLAVKILVKYLYQRRSEESYGLSSYSSGGISVSFAGEMPDQAKMILNKYKRWVTPL